MVSVLRSIESSRRLQSSMVAYTIPECFGLRHVILLLPGSSIPPAFLADSDTCSCMPTSVATEQVVVISDPYVVSQVLSNSSFDKLENCGYESSDLVSQPDTCSYGVAICIDSCLLGLAYSRSLRVH